ncbi:hypothetical protein GYMLUDRAFT_264372 [Collybiopsis luxurians FD-317 M1]|uniref:F-box domain-containing protein n=1 Tax=Collybiopsis luxurians FD-317 M1 TaxID=944289 RepID=A0A0D0CA63_9AGAR|nr:hypothetical protein GYMLUDRAFT_264372 [Collybiopsis luxurians FD-317 M1]
MEDGNSCIITQRFLESLDSSKCSMIRTSASPLLIPLRTLVLDVYNAEFDPSVFIDAISSRWIPMPSWESKQESSLGVACLRSVELYFSGSEDWKAVDKSVYEPLLRLERKGMRIVVKVKQLPNELLGKIFGFASNPNDLTSRLCGSWASVVSSVCARWRQPALNSPEVWSSMRIYLCNKDDYEAEPDAILTETVLLFLQRSKSYPLSLTFIGSSWTSDRDSAAEHPLLAKLFEYSSRWKHVSFDLYDFTPDMCSTWDKLSLPILETLTLESENDKDRVLQSPLKLLKNAPLLRVLHASNIRLSWDNSFPLPQTALQELKYDLNIGKWFVTAQVASPPLLLPNLSQLSVKVSNSDCEDKLLSSVLCSLTSPCIEELSLEQVFGEQEHRLFHAISSFLTRSSCSLRTMCLAGVVLSDKDVTTLLKQCLTLQDLCIEEPYPSHAIITRHFLESLHSSKRNIQTTFPLLVQSLHTLSLKVKAADFDSSVFIDAISSRWAPEREQQISLGVACLRSIELHLSKKVDKALYQPLLPFEKAGMRIVVKGQAGGKWEYIF